MAEVGRAVRTSTESIIAVFRAAGESPSPRLRGEGRGEGASPQALSGEFALAERPP